MNSSETLRVLVLSPDGGHEVLNIPRNEELRALQGLVGGYIEAVYGWVGVSFMAAPPNVTFFCNEEGKLSNQPVNEKATALWWSLDPAARGVDHLCGVVVVTGGADGNGDTLPVPDRVVDVVERVGGA